MNRRTFITAIASVALAPLTPPQPDYFTNPNGHTRNSGAYWFEFAQWFEKNRNRLGYPRGGFTLV